MKAGRLFPLALMMPASLMAADRSRPNIVLVFMDDMGYADVGFNGAKGYDTPNFDRMANEGMQFSNFYDAASISSPSRAGILTGCYPARVGINKVLSSRDTIGLNQSEVTLAEICKMRGYRTMAVGKWHLGCRVGLLPCSHGFDDFFGLPYSNDMNDVRLFQGNEVISHDVDQSMLTALYTEKSVEFIESSGDRPFFLYMAHTMPHIPLAVSDRFRGRSGHGLYGDVIMELDWSLGQIADAVERKGVAGNTLFIVTSDNGPWLIFGEHAGNAHPYRDGKFSRFEGGFRQFCAMRWDGVIPSGSHCHETVTAMDILPTVADILDVDLTQDGFNTTDGHSILPAMTGKKQKEHYKSFFYMTRNTAYAVRHGRWKLVTEHDGKQLVTPGVGGERGIEVKTRWPQALYDLSADPSETTDLSSRHPRLVKKLLREIEAFNAEIATSIRPAGHSSVTPSDRQ